MDKIPGPGSEREKSPACQEKINMLSRVINDLPAAIERRARTAEEHGEKTDWVDCWSNCAMPIAQYIELIDVLHGNEIDPEKRAQLIELKTSLHEKIVGANVEDNIEEELRAIVVQIKEVVDTL